MATLKVTIQEEITINGKDRGNKNTVEITSVSEVFNRVFTVTNTEQNILDFAANASGGALEDTTMQYLRVTNLDSTYEVDLRIQDTANTKEYFVQIAPSESFVLFNDKMDCDSTAVDTGISLSQIDFISADAPGTGGETADIEIFAVAT
jgi:hypothetical protein